LRKTRNKKRERKNLQKTAGRLRRGERENQSFPYSINRRALANLEKEKLHKVEEENRRGKGSFMKGNILRVAVEEGDHFLVGGPIGD